MIRNERGVTLVSLIITIIVMLILAAVTINMVINGGLFDQAGAAVEGTRINAINERINLAITETRTAFQIDRARPAQERLRGTDLYELLVEETFITVFNGANIGAIVPVTTAEESAHGWGASFDGDDTATEWSALIRIVNLDDDEQVLVHIHVSGTRVDINAYSDWEEEGEDVTLLERGLFEVSED